MIIPDSTSLSITKYTRRRGWLITFSISVAHLINGFPPLLYPSQQQPLLASPSPPPPPPPLPLPHYVQFNLHLNVFVLSRWTLIQPQVFAPTALHSLVRIQHNFFQRFFYFILFPLNTSLFSNRMTFFFFNVFIYPIYLYAWIWNSCFNFY